MTKKELLKSWLLRTRSVEKAHFESCVSFRKRHYILGGMTITLATLSTALTGIIENNDWASEWDKHPIILFSRIVFALATPIFAALVTFLKYESRSSAHHQAAANFAKMKRLISRTIVFFNEEEDPDKLRNSIDEICNLWDDLTMHSPALHKNQKYWAKLIESNEHKVVD